MKTSLIVGFCVCLMAATTASPAPQYWSNTAPNAVFTSFLQTSVFSTLTQLQNALASKTLTKSAATTLTQLQMIVSGLQKMITTIDTNALFSLPTSVTSGLSVAVTGAQTALDTASAQLGQVITAGAGASTTLINQLNSSTNALNIAGTTLQSQINTLLTKLSLSGSLSGTLG